MTEPTLHRVPTPGPVIAVRDHPGAEPAILALHGLASNARWWDLVSRCLPDHRLLAPDLRGHGLSEAPDTDYGFDAVVGDLRAVTDVLHPEPLVLAGHSWGASVALAFAASLPERTLAVICVDGAAMDVREFFGASWEVAEQAMRPPDLRGVTPEMLAGWLEQIGPDAADDRAAALDMLLGNFGPDPSAPQALRPRLTLERHMQIARALYDLDPADLLPRVRCPVLFVPAGVPGDGTSPKERGLARATDLLPGPVSVRWVDGVHDLPVQRPAEVAAAIEAFIDATVTASP